MPAIPDAELDALIRTLQPHATKTGTQESRGLVAAVAERRRRETEKRR